MCGMRIARQVASVQIYFIRTKIFKGTMREEYLSDCMTWREVTIGMDPSSRAMKEHESQRAVKQRRDSTALLDEKTFVSDSSLFGKGQ